MYLSDSGTRLVEAFDFDDVTGAISGRRTLMHIDRPGMAPDGLTVDEQGESHPVVGALPGAEGLFYATGHYRNGILLAPITAVSLAQEITAGSTLALMKPFAPERFFSHNKARHGARV